MRVLVTRPAAAATRTAARLTAAGHTVLLAPLLEPHPVAWTVPKQLPSALAFTSANAARLAGDGLTPLLALPAFAVGSATADAVRAAGFADVRTLGGTAAMLFTGIAATGVADVLHLAGAERIALDPPPGLRIDVRIVYASHLAETLPAVALTPGAVDLVLLYSPRTARRFAELIDAAALDRAQFRITALSPAALAAAGEGWASATAAAQPTEAALFAAAGLVCETGAREDEG